MDKKTKRESLSDVDENLLLKWAIKSKDREALKILYIKYYPYIRNYIYSHISSIVDSEDLTQDVFVEISKGHGNYNDCEKAKKYLIGISKNVVHRYIRNRAHSIKTFSMDSINNIDLDKNLSPNQFPADQIEAKELNKIIEKAINKLPSKARQALKLKFIDQLSPKEAAQKAGCSVNTFYQRVHAGIKAIGKIRRKGLDVEFINMKR